jgi:hypothetical protein
MHAKRVTHYDLKCGSALMRLRCCNGTCVLCVVLRQVRQRFRRAAAARYARVGAVDAAVPPGPPHLLPHMQPHMQLRRPHSCAAVTVWKPTSKISVGRSGCWFGCSSAAPNFRCVLGDFGESKMGTTDADEFTTRNRGTEFIKAPEMLTVANARSLGHTNTRPTSAAPPVACARHGLRSLAVTCVSARSPSLHTVKTQTVHFLPPAHLPPSTRRVHAVSAYVA